MHAFQLWLKEWKAILTNRKVLIPVIAVLFIPLLYSGMFLWAFGIHTIIWMNFPSL